MHIFLSFFLPSTSIYLQLHTYSHLHIYSHQHTYSPLHTYSLLQTYSHLHHQHAYIGPLPLTSFLLLSLSFPSTNLMSVQPSFSVRTFPIATLSIGLFLHLSIYLSIPSIPPTSSTLRPSSRRHSNSFSQGPKLCQQYFLRSILHNYDPGRGNQSDEEALETTRVD